MIYFACFNKTIQKDLYTILLPFLDSYEIFSFIVFFYNVPVQFLKHQYNSPMVVTIVKISLFILCRTSKPIVSVPGMCFALFLLATLITLFMKEWTGMEFGDSLRAAEDREGWEGIVATTSVVPRRPPRLRN